MSVFHGKVLVAQGGGPTAVINQSMVGLFWNHASSALSS